MEHAPPEAVAPVCFQSELFMARIHVSILALIVAFSACSADDGGDPQYQVPELNIDERPVEGVEGPGTVSYSNVLKRATPSVVGVYTAQIVEVPQGGPRTMEDLLRRHFGLPTPERGPGDSRGESRDRREQRDRRERTGVGSGVIVSENGFVVTNHHVITNRAGEYVDEIKVRLGDDREYDATLVGSDQKTDIAVLKIDAKRSLPAITIAKSDRLKVGDVVFAIGNPLEVGLTATQGIVSATGRTSLGLLGRGAYENFIQTDAAINLGNSGGALVDARGRLVGINTAILSRTGGSIGIGFAIPTNMVTNVMTNLIEQGEVPRGLLGVYPSNLNSEKAEAFGYDSTDGALVEQVVEGSPADKAGLRHGDIIFKVNDETVASAPKLRLTISRMAPGTEVDLHVFRDGKRKVIPVTLGSVSGEMAQTERGGGPSALEGVVLGKPTSEARERFSIPSELEGALVERVASDSPYRRALTPGMLIMEVNGKRVKSPEDVAQFMTSGINRLYAYLGGQRRYIIIRSE